MPGSPAVATGGASSGAAVPAWVGLSTGLFVLYVMLQVIEYGALSVYLPILKVTRFSTIISYLLLAIVVSRYGKDVLTSRQGKLFGTFVVFTGAGIVWAVVRSYVPLALRYHIDYFGLFVITAYFVDSRQRTTVLAVAFVAISTLLTIANRNMLGQDIRFGSFKASYFMSDGNDFGWGLIIMLPFALYLIVGQRGILIRLYGLAGFVVSVVGIIGTESRGATLALAAALLLFWATVAKHKALFVGVIVVLVMAVALLAPPAYFERMNSIQNYEEDNSAQGRLRAWRAARQMALDYPLGVGANNFNSAYGRFYIPSDTGGFAALRWISTHSCYFKVLAEYGYPGLTLFLLIIIFTFRDNAQTAKRLKEAGPAAPIPPEWPLLLNISLLGYSVCALFLGGITYPHLYLIAGLSVATSRRAALLDAPGAVIEGSLVTDPRPAAASPAWRPREVAAPGGAQPSPSTGRFF
jgi:probable O-glycosylation ligase (exosortase A-associated)